MKKIPTVLLIVQYENETGIRYVGFIDGDSKIINGKKVEVKLKRTGKYQRFFLLTVTIQSYNYIYNLSVHSSEVYPFIVQNFLVE